MISGLKKELVLINPKCGNIIVRNAVLLAEKSFPPLSLLTLSALTPQGYLIKLYNLKTFWPKKMFTPGILVGITCYSANARLAYRLAKRYKDAGASVVMGGPHVSSLPEEALLYCHSVVIGEAESVWSMIIRDYEEGCLKQVYKGEAVDDFFSPVFDSFKKLNPSKLRGSIQTTRGCKNACEFCVISDRKLRFVKHEQIIELIKIVKTRIKKPYIYFKDDNIFSSAQYAKELFRRLLPLKIRWYSFASIDIAFDDEALRLAKESGCYSLTIGLETIFPQKLPKAKKVHITTINEYLALIRKIKSYGIWVRGAFMMGFDYDRIVDYLKLIVFLLRARIFFVVLGIITPFPGTPLFTRLKSENRILTYNWDKYDCLHTVFRPQNMPAGLLTLLFMLMRIITLFLGWQTVFIMISLILYISNIINRYY